jgi:predicted DNA-binding transcriptional regulator AlpA
MTNAIIRLNAFEGGVTVEQIRYLTEKQVSEVTGIAVQTLRNWRQLRRGFPYSKVGRAVRYSTADVEEFMEVRRVKPQEM